MQITTEKPYKLLVNDQKELCTLEDENFGLCIACGEESYSCEVDAANYVCEFCGEAKVFGLFYLSINNRVGFI